MQTSAGKIVGAALFALATAGCASITYTSPGTLDSVSVKGMRGNKDAQAVLIDTTGYYLLWTIPLISGDARWDEETKSIKGGSSIFTDHVTVNELQSTLLKLADARNCDLAEVYVHDADSTYAGVNSPIGTLFGSSHMSISAILLPRTPAK